MTTKNRPSVENIREEGLDKFYTQPVYSKKCIENVMNRFDNCPWDLIVEPSAGNGSFLNQIQSKDKIGLDISPEHSDILQQDFFDYFPPKDKKNILVIGNPPFGKNSSLAVRFFNHSAEWANVIAFIVPRTFRKTSIQNRLNTMFHLIFDEETSEKPCCFYPKMNAKCCFQIWEKKTNKRTPVYLETKHEDWEFLPFGKKDEKGQPTPPLGADFALRAYGGKIGEIKTEGLEHLRPKSWHWFKSNIDKTILIQRLKQLNYLNSVNTSRQNSMGRGELIQLYTEFVCSKL